MRYFQYATFWVQPKPIARQASPAPKKAIEPKIVIPPTLQGDDEYDEEALDVFDESAKVSHSRLPKHHWRKDGLVDVNPNDAHPIHEPVRRAES